MLYKGRLKLKNIIISLRLSKSEYEGLKQKSKNRDMSVSDYIRNRISERESFSIKDKQLLCSGLTRIKDGIFNEDLNDASKAVNELWQSLRL